MTDEAGFSLVELLTAMTVGVIVMFAALAVMDGSWRVQAKTVDGIDTTDRGRRAIDRITQLLDGRVCLSAATASAQGSVVSATDDSIEFYASVTNDTAPRLVVERRRLTYRPASSDILLETWTGTAPPPTAPPANTTTPTTSLQLVAGVAPTGGEPVFRYYALDGTPALPTLQLATPITVAANRDSVVLVKVSFRATGRTRSVATEFHNDSLTRSPTCLFS